MFTGHRTECCRECMKGRSVLLRSDETCAQCFSYEHIRFLHCTILRLASFLDCLFHGCILLALKLTNMRAFSRSFFIFSRCSITPSSDVVVSLRHTLFNLIKLNQHEHVLGPTIAFSSVDGLLLYFGVSI